MAWLTTQVGVLLGTLVMAGFAAVLVLGRHQLGALFASDEAVILLTAQAVPPLAVSLIGEGANTVLSGIMRGCGRQKIGATVNLVRAPMAGSWAQRAPRLQNWGSTLAWGASSAALFTAMHGHARSWLSQSSRSSPKQVTYWVIGLPLSVIMAFWGGLGALGLWTGLACTASLQALLMTCTVFRWAGAGRGLGSGTAPPSLSAVGRGARGYACVASPATAQQAPPLRLARQTGRARSNHATPRADLIGPRRRSAPRPSWRRGSWCWRMRS
jgi:hypothetical protein